MGDYPSDFKAGERVLSPCGFQGVVSAADRNSVRVEYVGEKGFATRGVYDLAWFQRYPGMLKHDITRPRRAAR